MSNIAAKTLRDLLVADYVGFDRRLTRRLGSADLAADVIQETYLRIENIDAIGTVRNPAAYLFQIALNIARDHRRAQNRRLTADEVDCLLDVPDDRPGPEQEVEKRSELDHLRRAIGQLPERRRAVLLMSRIEGLPHREIAQRLGVTVRTVETDLKHAVEHCADRLKYSNAAKFGFRPFRSSKVQRQVARIGSLPAAFEDTADCGQTNRSHPSSGPADAGCAGVGRAANVGRSDPGGGRTASGVACQKFQA